MNVVRRGVLPLLFGFLLALGAGDAAAQRFPEKTDADYRALPARRLTRAVRR